MANNDQGWNDDNRWAGEADNGQERDRNRGYREGRYAEDRSSENRSYDDRHRSHPLRNAPHLNQDIGYGSGSLATGGYAGDRAPGSFSAYGASSGGGYGDGYGPYNGPAEPRGQGARSYGEGGDGYRTTTRYGGRADQGFGNGGTLATDDILDRQARGESGGGLFGRHRNDGEHRGRGPKDYKRSDERIRDDVNDRLTDDGWLDASDISVAVSDREVTLSGTVSSRDAKRRAESVAESVSGVDHVQNNLRVKREGDNLPPLPMV